MKTNATMENKITTSEEDYKVCKNKQQKTYR